MPLPPGWGRVTMTVNRTIGLLAGLGRLPVDVARAARGMGFAVIALSLVPGTDEELPVICHQHQTVNVGQLEHVISQLKAAGVQEVVMIGKVTKERLFDGSTQLDARALRLLSSLPDRNDDTILMAIVRELGEEGIRTVDQTQLIRMLLPQPGVLTKRAPSEAELADMNFGFDMAKEIGRLDIGQTVVVKNGAVMAVEAIEGTDACIRRGGQLGRGGVVVAKTAKPQQDIRFDMPSVGPDTLKAMLEAGATALVMEAGRTLLVEREATLALADENNIAILSRA